MGVELSGAANLGFHKSVKSPSKYEGFAERSTCYIGDIAAIYTHHFVKEFMNSKK